MPDAPVMETASLVRHFGGVSGKGRKPGVKAVDGADLAIRRGETFGLLGPNGAGRSTTLKTLVAILPPTSGVARVAGLDVTKGPSGVRREVGVVFREPSLDAVLTGRGNLELRGRLDGVPRRDLEARVTETLRLVDLEGRADDLVKKYSGGIKRRMEIARGLLHRPEALFLDEPPLGLDPATRGRFWQHIRTLREKEGTTVVLTTHRMDETAAFGGSRSQEKTVAHGGPLRQPDCKNGMNLDAKKRSFGVERSVGAGA